MSRVGLNPVSVPEGVSITIAEGEITAKGKRGELSYGFIKDVIVTMEDGLIKGVDEGFSVTLEINGVGYRAAMEGKNLVLQLGYSHNVVFPIPEGVTIKCAKPIEIIVSGTDKQQVGQVAANIRSFRRPEPYKGKGIKYTDEYIMRKEGKKK